jgi:transposase
MKKQQVKTRKSYPPEFKEQAIKLALEIGVMNAAKKLGIDNFQTLGAWVRYSKKADDNAEIQELEQLRVENKRLKKELEIEKKSVAILRDATAFFSRDLLK